MIQCGSCRRFIRALERTCPFCGGEQRSTSAAGAKGMLVFAAMTVLGASACSSDTTGTGDDGHETTGVSGTTSASLTETSTDTGESDTETDSLTFVPDEDIIAVYGGCDPFLQDCSEDEKCVPYASTGNAIDATKCVPVLGNLGAGQTCSYGGTIEATDDCDADSYCWNAVDIDGELLGECTLFCMGTPDDPMCPGSSSCLIAFDGSVSLCVDACDPLAQDCPAPQGCHYNEAGDDFVCLLGDAAASEPCLPYVDACAAGNSCVAAELLPMCADVACCTPFCDLDSPTCAPPGTDCVSLFGPDTPPAGFESVGLCVVP